MLCGVLHVISHVEFAMWLCSDQIRCLPSTFLLSLTTHSEGNERTFELEQILRNNPFTCGCLGTRWQVPGVTVNQECQPWVLALSPQGRKAPYHTEDFSKDREKQLLARCPSVPCPMPFGAPLLDCRGNLLYSPCKRTFLQPFLRLNRFQA